MKPKECVNSDCTEIFYVEEHKLDLPLQCEKCITKKEKLFKMNYKLTVEKTVVVKEEETLTLAQYVGRRLTMFRESAGLNVSALHRLTLASSLPQRGEVPGISHSSIASIEKGLTNPNLLALEMLCEALNIDIIDIFPPKQILVDEESTLH